MSFWDQYQDLGGGGWISAEEKQVLAENGIPLTVTGVVDDDENKYGARYVVKLSAPDPETGEEEAKQIGFQKGTVESRDRMLKQLQGYLAGGGEEPVVVKIAKVGRSYVLQNAAGA
jgi:hypothetical protein